MDARTLEALKASIAKWELNAEAKTPGEYRTGAKDCPLCDLFNHLDCHGCPVSAAAEEAFCDGTPYSKAWLAWHRWHKGTGTAEAAHAAAREEVAFLTSLLPQPASENLAKPFNPDEGRDVS